MKRECISIVILLCTWIGVMAQQVEMTYEVAANGEVTFSAENTFLIPYTLTYEITNISGATNGSPNIRNKTTLRPGSNRVLSLRPESEGTSIGFRYSYTYRMGDFMAKPDTNFVYLLPISEGRTCKINKLNSLDNFLSQKKEDGFTGLSFQMNEGDTVTAIRSGTVFEVQDDKASKAEQTVYHRNENFVIIYHQDGTMARYRLFKDGGIFVKPGDYMIAGQALGVIGGSNYEHGAHLRLSIYWFTEESNKSHIFMPRFYIANNLTVVPDGHTVYVSEHPVSIVTQEMSKKEKKKYMKKHSL